LSLIAPDHELADPLRELCQRAATAIMAHYHSAAAAQHEVKDDASPVTAADMAAHDILLAGLQQFGLPVLSEESPAEVQAQRQAWSRYWLVDPLDGTREYLARTGEFTNNIALF
jgi:3'(2'), 5'-bisphosphate nucleotidase